MLIFRELFLKVSFIHFELENGVMMTPKRRSILMFTSLAYVLPNL